MTAPHPDGTRACQHCEARIWQLPPATMTPASGEPAWADTDGGWYCLDGTTALHHSPMPDIPPVEPA
jgi:hypothetical protein